MKKIKQTRKLSIKESKNKNKIFMRNYEMTINICKML